MIRSSILTEKRSKATRILTHFSRHSGRGSKRFNHGGQCSRIAFSCSGRTTSSKLSSKESTLKCFRLNSRTPSERMLSLPSRTVLCAIRLLSLAQFMARKKRNYSLSETKSNDLKMRADISAMGLRNRRDSYT